MKGRTVLNWSLVVFEQQEFVSHIQQEERNKSHWKKDGDDPAESQGDEEGGDQVCISFTYGVYLVIVQFNELLFCGSGCLFGAAPGVPALLEAAHPTSKQQFDDAEGDVENHSHDEDSSYGLVPVRSKVAEFPLEDEVYRTPVDRICVVYVQQNHHQCHIHHQQKGTLEGVT